MASQTCAQCGATVPEDEQFCTDCGAFIDPLAPARPVASGNVISVSSDGAYEEFSLDAEPPTDEPEPQGVTARPAAERAKECPSCGTANPPNNRHCQQCGARLDQGPLPTAPRPAVQATAGVRAALAISGLLLVVIVVALIFNFANDSGEPTATTAPAATEDTAPVVNDPTQIELLDVECTPPGLGAFACQNLLNGTGTEYQVDWEQVTTDGEDVTIRLLFREPTVVTQIVWTNIADSNRFQQNFRARGLVLNAQGALTETPHELLDQAGSQQIPYATLDATWIDITIVSAYEAQVVEGNVFGELAIDEITVIGRPAFPATNTTAPAEEGGG